jgi:hypothetical protein
VLLRKLLKSIPKFIPSNPMILQNEITFEHQSGIAMCHMMIHDWDLCEALYSNDFEYDDWLQENKEYDL